jgi:hypothetical protein
VVVIDSAGKGMISERRFDAQGEVTGDTSLAFAWS